MMDLLGAVAAVAAALPRLISPDPGDLLGHAPTIWGAPAYRAAVDIGVSPAGQLVQCKAISSTGDSVTDARLCTSLRASTFAPPSDHNGQPVYGRTTFTYISPASTDATTPIISDLDVTVEHLPTGLSIRPLTQLALTTDAQGHVQACDVAKSSGSPKLDAVACKQGLAVANLQPMRNEQGSQVASVQSLIVAFSAYAKPVFKPNGRNGSLGDIGPYFPDKAALAGVSGYAVVACISDGSGSLSNCRVEEETPLGFGFGAATIKMARTKWMQVVPGTPGPVLIRINFPQMPLYRRIGAASYPRPSTRL